MKKVLKFIFVFISLFLFCFLFPLYVKCATKEIDDFACEYKLVCKDPINSNKVDVGFAQFMFIGYSSCSFDNSLDCSNSSFNVYYKQKEEDEFQSVTLRKKSGSQQFYLEKGNYLNYNSDKFESRFRNKTLYLFQGDNYGKNFAYLFKQSANSCHNIYCEVSSDGLFITPVSSYTSGYQTSSNELEKSKVYLRHSGENWKTPNEFYKEETTKPKDPLICNYPDMIPSGEYYDTGLNTGILEEKVNIVITTNYDSSTGNISSYNISANGYSPTVPITDLNKEVQFIFTGFGYQNYSFYIRENQTKKIFSGTCPDKDSLYLYLNQNKVLGGSFGYVLTTSKEEMEDEILNEDDNHNDTGANNGTGKKPSSPGNTGFGSKSMKCNEILGANLTKIVSTGITAMQIIGAIIAIVNGMITLIPAVMAKDAEGLKKAQKTLVTMAIILLIIFMLRFVIRWIGNIFDFDISCIV